MHPKWCLGDFYRHNVITNEWHQQMTVIANRYLPHISQKYKYSALFKPCYASRAGKCSDYNRIERPQEEIAFTIDDSHFCESSFCVVLYWIINGQLIFVHWI